MDSYEESIGIHDNEFKVGAHLAARKKHWVSKSEGAYKLISSVMRKGAGHGDKRRVRHGLHRAQVMKSIHVGLSKRFTPLQN